MFPATGAEERPYPPRTGTTDDRERDDSGSSRSCFVFLINLMAFPGFASGFAVHSALDRQANILGGSSFAGAAIPPESVPI